MKTDFKFSAIIDDGTNLTITVKFYEGEITTEDEPDYELKGGMKPVTRYRRSTFLEERTVVLPVGADYRSHFKKELRKPIKGKKRQPIPEQS